MQHALSKQRFPVMIRINTQLHRIMV